MMRINNERDMIELTGEMLEVVTGGRKSDNVKLSIPKVNTTPSTREEAFGIPRGGKIHCGRYSFRER